MVSENVEEIETLEEEFDQQQEPTDEWQLDNEETEDWTQRIAIKRGYYDGSIPSDISAPPCLSPKRAELARFLEWHRRTVGEIEHLEEAHHRAVEALGGERTTKAKIDALLNADIAEVLKFALCGETITPKKLRAFERRQLEQKLKEDKHAAEVASTTLQEIDHEIGIKTIGLGFLESRTDRFVKAALAEVGHQSDLAERYLEKIGELHDLMVLMAGLSRATGAGGYCNIEFPKFKFSALSDEDLVIAFDEKALDSAAEPWRKLGQQLINNPTADIASAFFNKDSQNDQN
jgi:hypothetical protein